MISRSAYAQLKYSPVLLAGVTLGMALTFLAGPLLALFGDGLARILRRSDLGADGAGVPADAAVLPHVAVVGAGAACDCGGVHAIHAGFRLPLRTRPGRHLEGTRSGERGIISVGIERIGIMSLDAAQHRSGKGSGDENFPVASWLVAPPHRRPILAFYEFVRIADDIADHATLPRGREARASRQPGRQACSAATTDNAGRRRRCARRWPSATCRRSTRRICSRRSARTSPSTATPTGTI